MRDFFLWLSGFLMGLGAYRLALEAAYKTGLVKWMGKESRHE